jgi:hypothetical protein
MGMKLIEVQTQQTMDNRQGSLLEEKYRQTAVAALSKKGHISWATQYSEPKVISSRKLHDP